jgi:hypothetical protein
MKKVLLVAILLSACSKESAEFWRVVEEQRAQGYRWKEIPCRTVQNRPALPLIVEGRPEKVCHILSK